MMNSMGLLTITTPVRHYHKDKYTRTSSLKHSKDSSTSLDLIISSTFLTLKIPKCCTLSGNVTPTLYHKFNRNMGAVATNHCHYWINMEMKPLPLLPLNFATAMIMNATTSHYRAPLLNLSSILI